jgi:protein required for attachment to host cells
MTQATHQPALFVLVADALSARLLHREPDGSLLERWQLYAADDRVRALGQSPDTRLVVAAPATAASSAFANETFVANITDRLRETCDDEPVATIILIAPHRFTGALRQSFGPELWTLVKHCVPRDETGLSEDSLLRLVDESLAA